MIEQARALAGMSEDERSALYRSVFSSNDGALVLSDLKFRSFYFVPSFTPDPQQAAFNEGMRATVLHIETMLRPTPEVRDTNVER